MNLFHRPRNSTARRPLIGRAKQLTAGRSRLATPQPAGSITRCIGRLL